MMSHPLDFARELVEGSISGASAVALVKPLLYCKNVQQEAARNKVKAVYSKDLRVWYRGVGGFAGSFVPVTAIQIAVSNGCMPYFSPLTSSVIGGGVSAIVFCPAEAQMKLKEKWGLSSKETRQAIYKAKGWSGFYRAFPAFAIREMMFTAAYGQGAPTFTKYFHSKGVPTVLATLLGGVGAGSVGMVASHVFDSYVTVMQRDLTMKEPMYRYIVRKEAWAGLGWRIGVGVGAVTMIAGSREVFKYFKEDKS